MDTVKIIAGVALGFLLGLIIIGPMKKAEGVSEGKKIVAEALAKNEKKNIVLKEKTDAEIEAMSGVKLCIVLGGLPDDCNK